MIHSVALFGHYKYRFELREIGSNRTVERFVDPPLDYDKEKYFVYACIGCEARAIPGDIVAIKSIGHRWTPEEQKRFLIVQMDILPEQINGICEPIWDLTSYEELPPDFWDKYIGDKIELIPKRHIKTRRFNISLDILSNVGVDIGAMLNRELIYVPKIRDIDKTEGFDKLRDRTILETDGLNVLAPIIIERPK